MKNMLLKWWYMLFAISMRLTFSGICFATPFFTHFTHGIKLTDEGASSLSIFKRVELQLQMRNFYTCKHIQYNAKHYFNIHHTPNIRDSKALSSKICRSQPPSFHPGRPTRHGVTLMKRTRMRCTYSFQLVTSISMRWRANIDYLCHLLISRRILTAHYL